MAQPRLPMRKMRDVLRLTAAGLSKRKIAASLGIGADGRRGCLRRAREAGVAWPLPEELTDEALEAPSLSGAGRPRPRHGGRCRTGRRSIASCKRPGRDAAAAVGGAPGRASRRLRLQPVLRALPRLGGASVADHAADACGRREAVRRLRRHDACR